MFVFSLYETGGLLSTDCKNKRVRDRFDYKNLVDYKVQNFENLTFCRRLDTTNWSVLIFSALRAATFIKKYMEIQKNIGREVLNIFCAARGHVYLENK